MWFMPIVHVGDLVSKVVYHYAEYVPIRMASMFVLAISSLTIISIFLSLVLIRMRDKIKMSVPPVFICTLIIMTSVLYDVFLTAHYQAPRYFLPLILIWEIFLPLFLFTLIDYIQFDFIKDSLSQLHARAYAKVLVIIALWVYPAVSLTQSLIFDYTYHALPWQK